MRVVCDRASAAGNAPLTNEQQAQRARHRARPPLSEQSHTLTVPRPLRVWEEHTTPPSTIALIDQLLAGWWRSAHGASGVRGASAFAPATGA
jgi:hypothetical protein